MKWLILLMLIACGKHEEPKSVDLRDSDGDQIQNYLEGEFEKYVADFAKLEKISGVIKYTTQQQTDVSFSNHSDLEIDTLKLVTGDVSTIERDQFFSEWSELRLTLPKEKTEVSSNMNTIHIHFEPTMVKPDELILIHGKSQKHLGKWAEYMRIQLNKEDFNGLLSGKLKLALRKKFSKGQFYPTDSEETIREKTYKVHIFDGRKSKILYVSKELSLPRLMEYLKITEITKISDEELFFNSQDRGSKQWFLRNYSNGNKAIAYYSIQDLKANFRKKFDSKKINLERINGSPVTSLALGNKANSKVYLTVRPTRTLRTFEEYTEVTRHRSGNANQGTDESWKCIHYMRKIATEVTVIPTVEEFLNGLNVKFEWEKEIKLIEQSDEKGMFWEVMLTAKEANLTLSLAGLNSSTFTTTGQHYIDCGYKGKGGTAATPTNFEGKLSFDIESFVEKIE